MPHARPLQQLDSADAVIRVAHDGAVLEHVIQPSRARSFAFVANRLCCGESRCRRLGTRRARAACPTPTPDAALRCAAPSSVVSATCIYLKKGTSEAGRSTPAASHFSANRLSRSSAGAVSMTTAMQRLWPSRYAVVERFGRAGGGDVHGRMRALRWRRREADFVQAVELAPRGRPPGDVQSACTMSTLSRKCRWLVAGSTPKPPYSYPYTPRPKPTSSRPPLIASIVAASSASRMGLCSVGISTPVPSRYAAGHARDVACDDQRGRPDAVSGEVMLRYPRAAEAQFLRKPRLLGRVRQEPSRIRAFWPRHMGEGGVFQRSSPVRQSVRAAARRGRIRPLSADGLFHASRLRVSNRESHEEAPRSLGGLVA